MRRMRSFVALIFVSVVASQGEVALGQALEITKVADSSTTIPGTGGETIRFFSGPPLIWQGQVVFTALDHRGNESLIVADLATNSLRVLANTSTDVPGMTPLGYLRLYPGSFDDGVVAVSTNRGVVNIGTDGSIVSVANPSTPIPGFEPSTFAELYWYPATDQGKTAFVAYRQDDAGYTHEGIYVQSDRGLLKVVDGSTVVPGTSRVFEDQADYFGWPTVAGDTVTFSYIGGSPGPDQGLYQFNMTTGELSTLFKASETIVPGRTTHFSFFMPPFADDNGELAIVGMDELQRFGVYATVGSNLVKIADSTTPVPGGSGNFADFNGAPSGAIRSGNLVAFRAGDITNQHGIYMFNLATGELIKVVDKTDTIDGRAVASYGLGGIDGDRISFSAYFRDGTMGVFVARVVPEPSSSVLLALGLGLFALRLRSNRFGHSAKSAEHPRSA